MKKLFVAINAKNIHKAIAPWSIKAYCEDNGIKDFLVLETNINDATFEIASKILLEEPSILMFSCYIWNIELIQKTAVLIKELLPEVIIILGGPEVSFEEELPEYTDYLIRGAGEIALCELIKKLEKGDIVKDKIISGCNNDFNDFPSFLTNEYFESFSGNQIPFIDKQLIYYESSRGCPFSCSYCISSTDDKLFFLNLDRVKNELKLLINKGAKIIKFVDRTFNANKDRTKEILKFIYSLDTETTFHFECAADLFDNEMLKIIKKMPAKRVQFEIGIQTTNEKTIQSIGRYTNINLALKNIKMISSFNNTHTHVDLIIGLPYETMDSFINGFNACLNASPHNLQLGFLKMLKGTRIRAQNDFGAVFAAFPPYQVYKTNTLSHIDLLKLKKIEILVEKFYNSGVFINSLNYGFSLFSAPYSFFESFANFIFSDSVHSNFKASIKNSYTILLDFLIISGQKNASEHYIKLDCLTYDSRGLLPDKITSKRDKQKEIDYKRINNTKDNIRIEYFEYDKKYRIFNYSKSFLVPQVLS
ncbi:MAG: B12-binding domain-containing radical SAM protein [Firmicutes bacterium]|nr:B12-binding domain-containing radical SAM protein [Bacillota bacterium]